MNYFSPGLRELGRKLDRQRQRLRRVLTSRKLGAAETELGLLGWQQAEFDSATEAHVHKLTHYEREQSRLTNEGAGLGKELRELREERETSRKNFEEQRRLMEGERNALIEPHPQIEKQLAELRKAEPAFARRMPELDRELRETNRLYSELLNHESQSAQTRQELNGLRERSVSIPNEKSDLRNQHLRLVSEIHTLESKLKAERETLAGLDQQLRELQAQFDTHDAHLVSEIRPREREKARIEKEINALESAKTNPYQEIGRVLADHQIAPMNQPGALEKVKRLRARILELEHLVSLSSQASGQENRQDLIMSWLLLGVIVLILVLVVLAAIPRV